MHYPIDIVIPWVDGNDLEWQKRKKNYSGDMTSGDNVHRFRDMNNLQYIFRGIEQYASWVNNVYFITEGHLPEWLNTNYEKLKIIKHEEYIPSEYLPTFSSHVIELNLHRIEGLSEHFIYFNDDTYLINETNREDFFYKGKPCDEALLNVHCYETKFMQILTPFINVGVINKYFNMKETMKQSRRIWYSPRYGIQVLRNIYLLPCPRFPGFRMNHLPTSFLKSYFEKVWSLEEEILVTTCNNRFRNKLDVNQWLIKLFQIMEGNIEPRSGKIGINAKIDDVNICDHIKGNKYKMICINDIDVDEEKFENYVNTINKELHTKLGKKSNYEK